MITDVQYSFHEKGVQGQFEKYKRELEKVYAKQSY